MGGLGEGSFGFIERCRMLSSNPKCQIKGMQCVTQHSVAWLH